MAENWTALPLQKKTGISYRKSCMPWMTSEREMEWSLVVSSIQFVPLKTNNKNFTCRLGTHWLEITKVIWWETWNSRTLHIFSTAEMQLPLGWSAERNWHNTLSCVLALCGLISHLSLSTSVFYWTIWLGKRTGDMECLAIALKVTITSKAMTSKGQFLLMLQSTPGWPCCKWVFGHSGWSIKSCWPRCLSYHSFICY